LAKKILARDPLVWTAIAMVVSVIAAISVYVTLVGYTDSPRVEDTAPSFALSTGDGSTLTLASQLQSRDAVILVFYRGYF